MLMPYLKSIFQLILTFLLLNDLKLTRQQQQVSMPNTSGGLNQNIYQFIKATQMTSRVSFLMRVICNSIFVKNVKVYYYNP